MVRNVLKSALIIMAALVLVPAASAVAHPQSPTAPAKDPYDLIWSGMWAGANLDATSMPHERSPRTFTPWQETKPAPKPTDTGRQLSGDPIGHWTPQHPSQPKTPTVQPRNPGGDPIGHWTPRPVQQQPSKPTSAPPASRSGGDPIGHWTPHNPSQIKTAAPSGSLTGDPIGSWDPYPNANPGRTYPSAVPNPNLDPDPRTNRGQTGDPIGSWDPNPGRGGGNAEPASSTGATPVPQANGLSPTGRQNIYVALGDSVAAGVGLPAPTGATAEDLRCGRSSQAYPYAVARELNRTWYHVACSGATAGDLFTKQRVDGPNIAPQLDTAFAAGTPSVMTITAGANDADWAGFIRKCYAFDCTDKSFTVLANARLVSLQAKLYWLFSDIKARSGSTPPKVVVTGYYNPLSMECAKLQNNITTQEIQWLSGQVSALNRTIKDVTDRYSFVHYTDVNFTGHDICSANPWIQGQGAPAPFHPTAVGQQAIADAIIAVLRR